MTASNDVQRGFSGLQVVLMILSVMLLTVIVTSWLILSDIFSNEFTPVSLDESEQHILSKKLNKLGISESGTNSSNDLDITLKAEPYSEINASRTVSLTERELNSLLARNTDLANKLAIDLSDDLLSAKLLLPLDEELPVLGGKTLKVTAGIELSYIDSKPVVAIKGVSIWGVPVPAAYMGDIKNVNLVEQYADEGFWKQFSRGVDGLDVVDGVITIKLKP